jgi:hypothetical protein
MDQAELLRYLLDTLDRQGLEYAITGSHASMAFGEARLTNDIDVLGSEKHLREITGMVTVLGDRFDKDYVAAMSEVGWPACGARFSNSSWAGSRLTPGMLSSLVGASGTLSGSCPTSSRRSPGG